MALRRTLSVLFLLMMGGSNALLPGSKFERWILEKSLKPIEPKEFHITGRGNYLEPYKILTSHDLQKPEEPSFAAIEITEDPDRIFQTSPPSPIDIALILKNLRRLNKEALIIAKPLAWIDPDIIALAALEQQMDDFPRIITSAPLSRGPVSTPLPSAFRRASINKQEIKGNWKNLPIVNRIALPDVILGNKQSFAGFTILESETASDQTSLMAIWDDRVVFSTLFLTILMEQKIEFNELEIQLGKSITFKNQNQWIAIDDYGRIKIEPKNLSKISMIPAEKLIDAPVNFLTNTENQSALLFDHSQQVTEENLLQKIGGLFWIKDHSQIHDFARFHPSIEWMMIASVFFFLLGWDSMSRSRVWFLLFLIGVLMTLHWFILLYLRTWPPVIPCLLMVFAYVCFPMTVKRPRRKHKSSSPLASIARRYI